MCVEEKAHYREAIWGSLPWAVQSCMDELAANMAAALVMPKPGVVRQYGCSVQVSSDYLQ